MWDKLLFTCREVGNYWLLIQESQLGGLAVEIYTKTCVKILKSVLKSRKTNKQKFTK
jgi:hypothetical protein